MLENSAEIKKVNKFSRTILEVIITTYGKEKKPRATRANNNSTKRAE
jgi:hypothetical protein